LRKTHVSFFRRELELDQFNILGREFEDGLSLECGVLRTAKE
jgi:hypothetical protein